jgi:hypothetical protein
MIQRGQLEEGIALLRRSIASLEADRYRLYTPGFGATLASGLASAGRVGEALQAIDEVIAVVEALGGKFILPELLRVRGELCAATDDGQQAESLFRRALALADAQAALSWRLRVAMSLFRLGRRDAERKLLADTYDRFTEGFATADLKAAGALLGDRTRARR